MLDSSSQTFLTDPDELREQRESQFKYKNLKGLSTVNASAEFQQFENDLKRQYEESQRIEKAAVRQTEIIVEYLYEPAKSYR